MYPSSTSFPLLTPFQNLWMTACHVFIDEISRVRHNKELYPGVEDELMDSYRNGLNVMSLFAQEGKLMREFVTFPHLVVGKV